MLSGSKRTASGEIIGSNFWQKNLGHDVGHGSCEVVTGGCSKPVCVNPAHLRLDYHDPKFSHDEAHSHWSCVPPSSTGQLDACHHENGLLNFSDMCLESLCQTAHPASVETTEDHCDGFVMSCAPCAPPCAAPCYGDQHCDAACEDSDCGDICYDEDCAEPECHSPYCPDDLCLVDEVCTQSPCPRAPSWERTLDSHCQQDGLDFNFDPATFDLGFEEEKGTQALLQLRSHGSKEPLDMTHTCPLTAHGWDPLSAATSMSGPSTQLYSSCSSGFPASTQYPVASGFAAPASTQSCNLAHHDHHDHHHGPYYHVDHIHHSSGGRHPFACDVASHYDSSTTCPPTPSSLLYTSTSNVSSPGPNLATPYSSLFQAGGLAKPPRNLSNRTRKRAKRAESLSFDLDGDAESVVGQVEQVTQSVEKTCLWELEDAKEGQAPVLCNKVFTSSKDLAAHMKQCHAAGVNGQYQCRWHGCNTKTQDFKQAGKLDRHFSTHNGYKRFQCHFCSHCSSTQQGLENHENTHTGNKPYKCDYPGCEYMAATATQKQNHYRSKHLKEKRFKCKYPGCTFDCTDSSNLTKHENGVHATKHFKCPHPGCTFPVVYNWTEIRHHFKESKHCPDLMNCHGKAQKQYKKSCVRKWPLPEGAERKGSVRSDRTGSVKSEGAGEVQGLEGLALSSDTA
ncbi:hypothetical protein K490DRAFT_68769 [Saccharata proteae CBS 121410]|uniref:C2H2-type domain-containing protein n=1 Tax=Saccharata proteae CBS 121410 TaxID=1314787 RepID=A0A9P4HQB3_9PEZI|nr:hypothetical protein K490DRAFT_68769 [Saccharata proteae CBS 121410]